MAGRLPLSHLARFARYKPRDPLVGTHHAGLVLANDELIQPLYLHQCLGCQVIGMSALQVLQRCRDRTAINPFSCLTAVSLVQFCQITAYLSLQLGLLALELRQAQMLALRRNSMPSTVIRRSRLL